MITIERNADITGLTTFGIPATAAALARWNTADDLRAILADGSLPRPFKVIGGGSNLLFTRPFEGTVIVRSGTPEARVCGNLLTADAHAILDDLCDLAASAPLRGMENLSGIPGTLGGALVQNAGAYGAETGRLLHSATLLDLSSGHTLEVDRAWMRFAYRSSRLKSEGDRYVILSATLRLNGADTPADLDYGNLRATMGNEDPTPQAVRRAVLAIRDSKLPSPARVGSAGSFFRNPEVDPALIAGHDDMPRFPLPSGLVKVPAAWLIDRCGLKGRTIGGAQVWPSQPLVIANADGHASAADILALENLIIQTVKERFAIDLTPEVEHI